MTCAILIPTLLGGPGLAACLAGIRAPGAALPPGTELVLADNGLPPGMADDLARKFGPLTFIPMGSNLGYARALNRAVAAITHDHFIVLNDDAVPAPGALPALLAPFGTAPDLFAVGARVAGGGLLQQARAVGRFRRGRLVIEPTDAPGLAPTLFAAGAAAAYARNKFLALGGFDERLFYWEDVELGIRAWRRGWPSLYQPAARVEHRRETTSRALYDEGELRRRQAVAHYLVLRRHLTGRERVRFRCWLPWQLLAGPLTGRGYVPAAWRAARVMTDPAPDPAARWSLTAALRHARESVA